MATTTRELPVRADGWRPTDPTLEGIIKRCVDDAEANAAQDGTREYVAGGLVLVILAVLILVAGQSVLLALLVPGVLFAAGAYYMVSKAQPAPVRRQDALDPIGGPSRLPAGYLVHPGAWSAGMAELVAYLPESQLRAATELCRAFPGSVDDLLVFTGTIAAQFPVQRSLSGDDVHRRSRELVRVGIPILKDFNDKYPPVPAGKGKKGKG
jgi:hypothetical protein